MARGAEHWAREIVKARMEDNHALADSLEPRLRDANRERRASVLKSIRPTQQWYFDQGGGKPEGSFKKGGTVSKTGTYKLHKGEKVVPAKQAKRKR